MPWPGTGHAERRHLVGGGVVPQQVVALVRPAQLQVGAGAPVRGRDHLVARPEHHRGVDLAVAPVAGLVAERRGHVGRAGERVRGGVELVEPRVAVAPEVVAERGHEPAVGQHDALAPLRPGVPFALGQRVHGGAHGDAVRLADAAGGSPTRPRRAPASPGRAAVGRRWFGCRGGRGRPRRRRRTRRGRRGVVTVAAGAAAAPPGRRTPSPQHRPHGPPRHGGPAVAPAARSAAGERPVAPAAPVSRRRRRTSRSRGRGPPPAARGEVHIWLVSSTADQVLGRVVGPHASRARRPSRSCRPTGAVPVAPDVDAQAEAPARAPPSGDGDAAASWSGVSWLVVIASTVGRDSSRRAAVDAAGEQHRGERGQVVDGRHQAVAAAGERRRRGPLAVGRVVDGALAGVGVGAVDGPEPVAVGLGHEEAGVVHAERLEHPLGEHDVERLARGPGDQHPEDVGAGVVQPAGARAGGRAAPTRRCASTRRAPAALRRRVGPAAGPRSARASSDRLGPGRRRSRSPSPLRNVSRSRTVIGRSAGTVSSSGPVGSARTRRSASSGSRSSTGSSRRSRHSSTSISAATAVIGLVVDEMR